MTAARLQWKDTVIRWRSVAGEARRMFLQSELKHWNC